MQVSTTLQAWDVPEVMDWLGAQIGAALRKRVEDLEHRAYINPLFECYSRQAYAWEFALERARRYRRMHSGHPPRGDHFDTAYGFAATLQRVYRELNAIGQKQLSGRLRDAMTSRAGLRPIAYEIQILTHLTRRGFDVECVDLSGQGNYDFLATGFGESIEVECKTTAPDAGLKVHLSDLSSLGGRLWPAAKDLLDREGLHLVLIEVPDRLENKDENMQSIYELFIEAISGHGYAVGDTATVVYKISTAVPIGLPESVEDRLRAIFIEEFGREAGSIAFYGRAGGGTLALGVKSARPNNVAEAFGNQAKEAAEQCTGQRPAVIAMQISEIPKETLSNLVKSHSGLHEILRQVLKEEHRRHVESIAFTVPPIVQTSSLVGVSEIKGLAGVLFNPEPTFGSVAARDLFRAIS